MLKTDPVHTDDIPIVRFLQQTRIRFQVQSLPHIAGKFIGRNEHIVDPASNLIPKFIYSVFDLFLDSDYALVLILHIAFILRLAGFPFLPVNLCK